VTSFLTDLSKGIGGRLEGLEFALKSDSSLSRKIALNRDRFDLSLADAASDIHDALRYTMVLDSKSFGTNIQSVFKSLEAAGYKKTWVTNTFLDKNASYKGINSTFSTKNGQSFELQFHTADTFDVKENINHSLFEEARLLETPKFRVEELNAQMLINSSNILKSQGIDLIQNYWPGY
jgi:hypothetical protein